MALSLNISLLYIIISTCQITFLTSICPNVLCACHNSISQMCESCYYNLTLKENNMNVYHSTSVCCNEDVNLVWFQLYANKTWTEVAVQYSNTCNMSIVDFDVLLLDTYSLSLKNNSIIHIKLNVKPQNLQEIDITSNRLQYVNKGLFNSFINLRKLNLHCNNITNIYEESFDGLTKLESLDLSENKLTSLANIFTPLKNLQHLNLSRNNIEFINENYFDNWLLQHLDVSHNNLRKLAPGALQLLPNLARLLLTDNPHLGITQLDSQLLVGTGRRLQQIDASRTGLYQVPEAFTHSVRFLSLIGNRISAVRCGDLDSYPLLQSLDFSDNKIVSIEDDSIGRLEMLLFLNINKNFLTSVPKSLPDELKYLSINNNVIKNLSNPDFNNLPNLRILLLQNNNIHYIEDHVFDDLLSLEMLDLSNNPIQTLSSSTFDGPLSLRDLRLCYLNLSLPEQDGTFPMSSPESVQMLHLQSSPGLAKQFLADSAALTAFTHLQYLDLRMNSLSHIRNDLLFYLGQLKTLRLHGNHINCSAELWLKDWINGNKTLSSGETCYYSTSEARADITKYNCTFPETFTISDSLPPVNLYSTEMINKLLRYYGYLNNKTERNSKRGLLREKPKYKNVKSKIQSNKTDIISTVNSNNYSSKVRKAQDTILLRNENKITINDYYNGTVIIKARESSKAFDQNRVLNDQLDVDKFIDIESYLSTPLRKLKNTLKSDVAEVEPSTNTGKRLNTPISNIKKVHRENYGNESKLDSMKPLIRNVLQNISLYEANTSNSNEKGEYSHYRSASRNYAQYVGTVAVCSLIVFSLILWVSFRLKYRSRRVPIIENANEDQIEVSNISGRVLW
ncbi:hypothetical protein O3G_MSEX001830 [Manduca sexta]|uniref:Uncharacterized protein n=1 Tax=Manduca sexta TaxID=7130 RepID=A0A921YLC6_MANSE|nr:hypothetical protein O3G_MSEX001830 [Manduca sexta]KAG6441534.1 hypothetical protein O3G_MSEX001830 [Manduca sexta]